MTEPMPMTIADAQPISFEEMVRRNDGLSDRLRDAEDLIYRLKKSQNLLNQSGRLSSVGQLAAMVVHEIRGPLTGISGQAELLLMQELTDKQRRSLDLILTAAWRLNDLTEDIMLFSLGPDERAPVADLGHVVERVVSQLRPLASSRVGIQLQLLPAGLDVDGCGWLLAQVMTNLLLNALDAKASQVVVTTGVSRLHEGGEAGSGWNTTYALPNTQVPGEEWFAYAEVSDDGTGIEEKNMSCLFEPLFTTKTARTGAGLGLAICRNITRDLGGNMRVSTRSGVGTKVRLLVPMSPTGECT